MARTALKDQKVANADVVAGNGDGIWRSHGRIAWSVGVSNGFGVGRRNARNGWGSVSLLDYDFLTIVAVVMVVVVGTVDGMEDVLSCSLKAVTEGVVVALVVVVSHIKLVLLGGVDSGSSSLLYSNFFYGLLRELRSSLSLDGVGLVVLCLVEARVVLRVLLSVGTGPITIFTLGDIDLGFGVARSRTVCG